MIRSQILRSARTVEFEPFYGPRFRSSLGVSNFATVSFNGSIIIVMTIIITKCHDAIVYDSDGGDDGGGNGDFGDKFGGGDGADRLKGSAPGPF